MYSWRSTCFLIFPQGNMDLDRICRHASTVALPTGRMSSKVTLEPDSRFLELQKRMKHAVVLTLQYCW